jgi:hypothetical protein
LKRDFSFLLATMLLLSLFICCHKKSTCPRHGELPDFPNTIGSRFVYSHFDSLSMTSDTITASIVDTFSSNHQGAVSVWEYRWNSSTRTGKVYYYSDTVMVHDDAISGLGYTIYVFPLEIGKGWKDGLILDTSTVIDRVPVCVPAGIFAGAFLIERRWSGLQVFGHELIWLVPRVGIVKKHHWGWSFGWANQTWELIEYHIVRRE